MTQLISQVISHPSMLLVLPVPFRVERGELYVEAQAANGLDRWADSFSRVVVAAPLIPESLVPGLAGVLWKKVSALEHQHRIVCHPLPWAYTPPSFLRTQRAIRRQLRHWIAESDHLQFAIGGLWGDWAAIAAVEAARMHRRYAIHTDRVEHILMRKTASGSVLRRAKIALEAPLMERFHRHVIKRCSLGLWHGDDCFQAYAPWTRPKHNQNHLVHDIHTHASDLITDEQLERKIAVVLSTQPLELCYAGRLDPMKAPLEWLQAIAAARAQGAHLHATWYGEGAMLAQAQAECFRLNLADTVTFAGFVAGRADLLANVRQAQAFVFTHVTPESPRNLLEALVCGTPLVGYANPYASNLIAEQGGGALVPLHNTEALGNLLAELSRDRIRLATLMRQAAHNGRRFTDAAVFAERSDLVKRYA